MQPLETCRSFFQSGAVGRYAEHEVDFGQFAVADVAVVADTDCNTARGITVPFCNSLIAFKRVLLLSRLLSRVFEMQAQLASTLGGCLRHVVT